MKKIVLSIAAASAIMLGTVGAATAGVPAAKAGLFEGAGAAAKTQTVHYTGWRHRHRHWRYRQIRHRRMCRRLRYRGWVLGNWHARRMFHRLCTHRRYYGPYGY